ncbi:hypothetical protein C8Q77DRAFT_1057380 [Trametes polyzona]|nr:hypothetical protein C8Q77DRAFT_1057380 [Trametes polyzona]
MDEDYFGDDDDFVLDDALIAALDHEESKYQEAQQPTPQVEPAVRAERRPADAPPPARPPPPKRQKTSHKSSEGRGPDILQNPEDDEGLPEVSIVGGGSYGFPAGQTAAVNALAAQLVPVGGSVNGQRSPNVVRTTIRHEPPVPPRAAQGGASATGPSGLVQTSVTAAARGPPSGSRPRETPTSRVPRRSSTLSSIQAALAGFVPSATPSSTPVPSATRPPASRNSPAPPPSRAPANAYSRRGTSPALPPSHSRASVPPPPSAPRTAAPVARHAGPSYRRQSVTGSARPHTVPSPPVQARPPPPQPPPPSQGQPDRRLRIELDTLRAQLDEVLRIQDEQKKALEEERNTRYAKEGEVSILRKNMEKTAKDHAAEVARIKAAKEAAEAAQAQLRKEMAEEKERLRTQFMFKQHELETSVRKTPWSVRIKRTEQHAPVSPVVSATQRRQAAAATNGHNGGPSSIFRTPSRPRYDKSLPNSPERSRGKKAVESPPPKKSARLPGFYNAFEPSPLKASLQFSQLSQSTQVKGKGKGRMEQPSFDLLDAPAEDLFFNPRPAQEEVRHRSSSPSSPSSAPEELGEEVFVPDDKMKKDVPGPGSATEPATSSPVEEDVEMKDDVKPPESMEPAEPLQTPDWTKELHRIVLTHKPRGSKQPTLQLLMNHTMPASVPAERAQEYSMESARLLESLGMAALKIVDADEVILSVERSLTTMGRILCVVGSIAPLAALLDLMKVVALFIPAFVPLALAPSEERLDAPSEILVLLCEAVKSHLSPVGGEPDDGRNALASEVLGLLEVICWYTPSELAARLSVFLRKAGVLSTLLNGAQPTWLLLRTVRALTLAASHHTLWKDFLSFPLPDAPAEENVAKDFTRIPHIEQLASLLVDRARDGLEGRPLREAILNFVTTLAIAHGDSLSILLLSHTLLPSIVVFLHNITAPLWEEDEAFMEDSGLITWTVQMTTRTILLLHHLMANADASKINLRQKLMVPPRRFANSLWHTFTVSLGRLTYACPPEWVGSEHETRLDQICDMARELLEIAVDGPELESIWAAFQVDDDVPGPRTQYDEDGGETPRSSMRGSTPRHSAIEID